MWDLAFLGATGTVTGSKYRVRSGKAQLLVDCGLYQGVKQLRLRNRKPPPVDVERLDALVLSHAHIDHSGYLPALVRDGYEGPVYCTPATRALCGILLPDAGRIQEEDAEYANRKHFSKHHPALPLYTEEDAMRALERLVPLDFGEELAIGDLRVELRPAGHILGAASVAIRRGGRCLLFSGDLGRSDDLLMLPPTPPGRADWIVCESTYGDRLHDKEDPIEAIGGLLRETLERSGMLLIPSFAVGRAQTVLYCLHEAFRRGLAPEVPIYLNSPMATSVTALYSRFASLHRLDRAECAEVFDSVHYVRSVDESKDLSQRGTFPGVIVSASGMATGGRVLHHLKTLAPDSRNTILLPGFQAEGTRGEALASGAEAVKIHGGYVPVRARVVQLDILSAHADQIGLMDWVQACEGEPRAVYLTHGNPRASDTLRRLLQERMQTAVSTPEYRDEVELD
jgi:metallo-beta-lactamase family protein